MVKKILRAFWISALLVCFILYMLYGQYLTAASIKQWITEHTHALVIVYSLICIIRGLTLIPATPFILAGILLFPQNPVLLLLISLGCILLSSTIIYYASGYMGFADYFEKRHSDKIANIREKLSRPSGFYFIAAWSVLPFTPTDLVVYVAGSIKLPFTRMIIPLMLGEAVICSVYIFNGVQLMEYIS